VQQISSIMHCQCAFSCLSMFDLACAIIGMFQIVAVCHIVVDDAPVTTARVDLLWTPAPLHASCCRFSRAFTPGEQLVAIITTGKGDVIVPVGLFSSFHMMCT
jgi:hypothetical protein